MSRFYTGVGSRETPPEVISTMQALSSWLNLMGYTLRSGAAAGADTAFELGAHGDSHIYTPWPRFSTRPVRSTCATLGAYNMAATVHPAWNKLTPGARSLHARNCHQVLGDDLDTPSRFLVCWTPDGCNSERTRTRGTGGTATAIVLACRHGVPVYNLRTDGALAALEDFIARLG